MTVTTPAAPPTSALVDEHSVLLWQTAAYADELTHAARPGHRLTPAFDALVEFLHYRLLPYLSAEERALPPSRLRDERLTRLLLDDHERLRADVENVEHSRSRRLLTVATEALVDRLDRHLRREETWMADPAAGEPVDIRPSDEWALPLVLGSDVDVDALPPEHRDTLLYRRLQRMRPGETVRLRAGHDLESVWSRQHAVEPGAHVCVYEQAGPTAWVARITSRVDDVP